MVPSIGTALNAAIYGDAAPTFVEPRGRRAAVVLAAALVGAVVTLVLVTRLGVGEGGTIFVSYVVIFALMHAFGFLAHLLGLAGEPTDAGN